MGLVTTSLRTSRAARVRKRALQRGRRRRAATTTTRVTMKAAMAGTGGAGDGRDGRRRGILDKPPDDLRGEGRDAKTTSGALARRGCVGIGRCSDARPPMMQKTTGGAATSPVKDMLAGLGVAAAIHVKTTGRALARRSGQYEGIGNPTAQPQQMASASTGASVGRKQGIWRIAPCIRAREVRARSFPWVRSHEPTIKPAIGRCWQLHTSNTGDVLTCGQVRALDP